jgi:hypothetical protein
MVEYGHGVGEVAGRTGGRAGGVGGGGPDLGAGFTQLINDTVNTISAIPPEMLLAGVLAILVGLALFRRAL